MLEIISLMADDISTEVKQDAENLEYNIIYAVNPAMDRRNMSSYHRDIRVTNGDGQTRSRSDENSRADSYLGGESNRRVTTNWLP